MLFQFKELFRRVLPDARRCANLLIMFVDRHFMLLPLEQSSALPAADRFVSKNADIRGLDSSGCERSDSFRFFARRSLEASNLRRRTSRWSFAAAPAIRRTPSL